MEGNTGGCESLIEATEGYNGDVDSGGGESRDEDSDDLSEDLPTLDDIFDNTPKAAEYIQRHCLTMSRDASGPELT